MVQRSATDNDTEQPALVDKAAEPSAETARALEIATRLHSRLRLAQIELLGAAPSFDLETFEAGARKLFDVLGDEPAFTMEQLDALGSSVAEASGVAYRVDPLGGTGDLEPTPFEDLLNDMVARQRVAADMAALEEMVAGVTDEQLEAGRQAVREAVGALPMVSAGEAAELLGAKRSNREKVRLLREGSQLLGLPKSPGLPLDQKGQHYRYPTFQFDPKLRTVRPAVAQANQVLDAKNDPWGVGCWWITPSAVLGMTPTDALIDRPNDVVAQARAAVEWLG